MKNKFKKSVFLLSSLMMLSVGAGIINVAENTVNVAEAADQTYSYTFESKQFSANGTKTLDGVKWTLSGDGGYWGYDGTKGQQLGSSGKPYKSMTLTSSEFTNVSEITINTAGASSIKASFIVSVGGTQVGSTTTVTTTATTYTFSPNVSLTGSVIFTYTQTSSKALYIKSISVTYDDSTGGGEGGETPDSVECTLTFDANGGKFNNNSVTYTSTVMSGNSYNFPENPSREDYNFDGWYDAVEGGTKVNSLTASAENTTPTLYAHWNPKIKEPTEIESSVEALADAYPTEYEFKQIYIVEGTWNCTNTTYGNGSLSNNDKSIEIYGMGQVKSDILTWDDVQGKYIVSNNKTYANIGLVNGDTIRIGVVYGTSGSYKNYYSYFIEKLAGQETYTITFDAGTKGTASDTSVTTTGEFEFPSVTSNSAYYQFSGWYLESDEETLYTAGNSYTAASNLTFVAKYETVTPKSYVYELVTDASTLVAGDKVIIAAKGEINYAMSTNQKTSNRGATEIKKIDNMLSVNFVENDIEVLTLEAGKVDGTFAFNTGEGYLYASSGSSNQLKTQVTNDENSSWLITVKDSVASIVAQGSNTRNTMQFNPNNGGSPLFACYSSASQTAIEIYKVSEKSLSINFMYNDDENPEAIRFISTIEGFDASEIETVQYSFVKDGVAATPEAEKYIYESISGSDVFVEKANTYYAVYAIRGVQGVLNDSFNATITVTLTNSLVLSVTSTTFNLGSY